MSQAARPETMARARELFSRAQLLHETKERQALLDQTCGDDTALRRLVEGLLRAHDDAPGFLDRSVTGEPLDSPQERIGTVIDRYRILELLGEGGFAEVYRAEQTEPVRREVALKVIKPGMASREVIARFEAERQALAVMEHPYIARILDGGALPEGLPYFVMDLVPGIPITRYCREKGLPLRSRLEMFVKVCAAVEHAHSRGIIHRDLKPSNIVVTEQDGLAEPKVIDFGIAKCLNLDEADKSVNTRSHVVLGTPSHMSPEQAAGSPVTKASDIFSLGSILYELLTDQSRIPRSQSLQATRRLLDREETSPRRVNRRVPRDLATICLKCLEREPSRRYRTARSLAEDLDRWLHGETIMARPTRPAERMLRWTRRYPAATGLIASLACGAVVTTLFLRQALRLQETTSRVASMTIGLISSYVSEQAHSGEPVIRVDAEVLMLLSPAPSLPDPHALSCRLTLAAMMGTQPDTAWLQMGRLILHLQQHMETSLGIPVLLDLDLLRDDEVAGEYLATNQTCFARISLPLFLRLEQESGAPQPLVRQNLQPRYDGVVIASARSGIHDLSRPGDVSLVLGDVDSALSWNGWARLIQSGGSGSTAFRECAFLADQLKVRNQQVLPILPPAADGPRSRFIEVVELVADGTYDVGITFVESLGEASSTNGLEVLDRFPVIDAPWVVGKDVALKVAGAFVQAMRAVAPDAFRLDLGEGFDGFVKTSARDYEPLIPALGFGPPPELPNVAADGTSLWRHEDAIPGLTAGNPNQEGLGL